MRTALNFEYRLAPRVQIANEQIAVPVAAPVQDITDRFPTVAELGEAPSCDLLVHYDTTAGTDFVWVGIAPVAAAANAPYGPFNAWDIQSWDSFHRAVTILVVGVMPREAGANVLVDGTRVFLVNRDALTDYDVDISIAVPSLNWA